MAEMRGRYQQECIEIQATDRFRNQQEIEHYDRRSTSAKSAVLEVGDGLRRVRLSA